MEFDRLYIDGEWIESESEDFLEVIDPRTEEIVGRVPKSNNKDLEKAVRAGRRALGPWMATSPEERIQLMIALREIFLDELDDLAEVVAKELGASHRFAREVHLLGYIDDISNYIQALRDYSLEEEYDGFRVLREPVGLVGAITPWNYPFGQISKKIVPALLAGNTVILKPSQQTPLIAYHLTDAIDRAGFPAGVFNLLPGVGREIGDELAAHPDLDMISFTGSTSGGIKVSMSAMKTVKKLALELGGKSASILMEDGDLDSFLETSLDTAYSNTGQTCSALTRLFIPESRKEEVEKAIVEKTRDYSFYNTGAREDLIGPLISQKQFDKVKFYIEKGIEEGARLLLGEVPNKKAKGFFVGPTIFTDVTNDMTIAREEIFGPVLCLIVYRDLDQVIEEANDSAYGLSGAVFGNEDQALKLAKKLRTGMVIVNGKKRSHKAPFGGYKKSGIGREGGVFGLEEYLETKTIFV